MNTKDFDAKKREQSAQRVASGKSPLPRMTAPTLFSMEDNTVYLASGKSGAVRAIGWESGVREFRGSEGISADRNLTSAAIAGFFTETALVDVCFVDRASLSATLKILSASKTGFESRVGRVVKYLVAQPAMSRCSVLTDALAQKFWTPTGLDSSDLNAWASMIGGGTNDATRYARSYRLASLARAGSLAVLPTANFRTSSNTIANSLLRWSGAKVEAFTAVQNHNDVWDAVCGSDPLLYERGLLVGSTVRVVPVRFSDGVLEAEVSMPFKLRPGNNITVFGGVMPKGLPVRLRALDFDNETGKLLAKIIPAARRKKGEPDGFFFLSVEESHGKEFFAINEPFSGGGFSGGRRSATGDEPRRTRELPLDVALAASV
jgi:hypothetical protein